MLLLVYRPLQLFTELGVLLFHADHQIRSTPCCFRLLIGMLLQLSENDVELHRDRC